MYFQFDTIYEDIKMRVHLNILPVYTKFTQLYLRTRKTYKRFKKQIVLMIK